MYFLKNFINKLFILSIKMAVKDLQARQGNVELVLDIIDVGEAREFEKFGKTGRVASAIAKDDTGDIKLSLWNEQIDQVKAGDKIKITNGYVSEWQGELQLTTGKFGQLEVIGESEAAKQEMAKGPDEEKNKEFYEQVKKSTSEVDETPITDEEDVE